MKRHIRTTELKMYVKEIVSVKQITYATLKEALKNPGLNKTGLGFNGPASCRSLSVQAYFLFSTWFFRNAISYSHFIIAMISVTSFASNSYFSVCWSNISQSFIQ